MSVFVYTQYSSKNYIRYFSLAEVCELDTRGGYNDNSLSVEVVNLWPCSSDEKEQLDIPVSHHPRKESAFLVIVITDKGCKQMQIYPLRSEFIPTLDVDTNTNTKIHILTNTDMCFLENGQIRISPCVYACRYMCVYEIDLCHSGRIRDWIFPTQIQPYDIWM